MYEYENISQEVFYSHNQAKEINHSTKICNIIVALTFSLTAVHDFELFADNTLSTTA